MRTELLCALVCLCGADLALAQQAPVYPYPWSGYYQGYRPAYPTTAGAYGYYNYAQPGYSGYYYAPSSYPTNSSPSYVPNAQSANVANQGAALAPPPMQPPSMPIETSDEMPAGDAGPIGSASAKEPILPSLWASLEHVHIPNPFQGVSTHQTFWVNADYMMAWLRTDQLPGPLVTTGSPPDAAPGVLGQPGTAILFGNTVNLSTFSGMKAEFGCYLDPDNNLVSVDLAGFWIFSNSLIFRANSSNTGNPLIARPFFDIATNAERAELDAFPSLPTSPFLPAVGGSEVDDKSQLYGFELNGRIHGVVWDQLHVDALVGLRYLRLDDDLKISDQANFSPNTITILNNPVMAGSLLSDFDSFQTTNSFYGIQIGTRAEWEHEWFYASAFAKIGLGATVEHVNINGATSLATPLGVEVASGGILALPSNIGSYNRTVLGMVPELGLTLGANVTSWLRLTAGYSFLYWNAVTRPGNAIDRTANSTQIPGDVNFGRTTDFATGMPLNLTPAPTFRFNEDSFWVNALNVGVEIHY